MKIKTRPLDFRVNEIVSLPIGEEGEHLVFALKKTSQTTDAALESVSRALGVRRGVWSAAGMKDRHAQTTQHVSVHEKNWPREIPAISETFQTGGVTLQFLGRAEEAVARGHIVANEFTIAVRKLTRAKCAAMKAEWGDVLEAGVPNYFDTQRFGSCRHGRGLPMVSLLRGEGDAAMRLLLAEASRKDHRSVKERARRAGEVWGDWAAVAACFGERSAERLAAEHLAAHPGDFAGAFCAYELRSSRPFNVLAFQSLVFNLMLSSSIRRDGVEAFEFDILHHCLLFVKRRPEIFARGLSLPLVRPGISLAARWSADFEYACEELGIATDAVAVCGLPRELWDRASRPVWADVGELGAAQDHKDELHAERRKLILRYRLPAGAYATMALKRLEAVLRAR